MRTHAQKKKITPENHSFLDFSGATVCKFTGATRAATPSLDGVKFNILLWATGCQRGGWGGRNRAKSPWCFPHRRSTSLGFLAARKSCWDVLWIRLLQQCGYAETPPPRCLCAINPDNLDPRGLCENGTMLFAPVRCLPVKVAFICCLRSERQRRLLSVSARRAAATDPLHIRACRHVRTGGGSQAVTHPVQTAKWDVN